MNIPDLRHGRALPRLLADGDAEKAATFAVAMNRYKEVNRRPYPTWAEAYWVLLELGMVSHAEKTGCGGGESDPACGGDQ